MLLFISLVSVVSPEESANTSVLSIWTAHTADSVTCSSPDSMSVKLASGPMAACTDSSTSMSR